MNLYTQKSMQGESAFDQACKAIRHTLLQIKNKPFVAWYLGFGTETFALLTEAAATISEEPVELVRERFVCIAPQDPQDTAPVSDFSPFDPVCEEYDDWKERALVIEILNSFPRYHGVVWGKDTPNTNLLQYLQDEIKPILEQKKKAAQFRAEAIVPRQ